MSNWFQYDGKWFNKEDELLSIKNRGLLYGDGVFETMRTYGTTVLFFENHIARLHKSLEYLSIPISDELQPENLKKSIKQLINKNKWFAGGRVRLTVFRNSDGLYTPKNSQTSYLLQGNELKHNSIYPLLKGEIIGLFTQDKKATTPLSAIKSISSLLYVRAGLFCQQNNFKDCFIMNTDNDIIECLSSNIFIVKDKKVFVPKNPSGAILGTMQVTVLGIFKELNYELVEKGICKQDILEADEIITTNAIQGIQYVLGFENNRYYSRIAQHMSDKLNFIANNYILEANSKLD